MHTETCAVGLCTSVRQSQASELVSQVVTDETLCASRSSLCALTVILAEGHLLIALVVDYCEACQALETLSELIGESAVEWVLAALAKTVNVQSFGACHADVVGQNVVIDALDADKIGW